jgi:hypothetical protein
MTDALPNACLSCFSGIKMATLPPQYAPVNQRIAAMLVTNKSLKKCLLLPHASVYGMG